MIDLLIKNVKLLDDRLCNIHIHKNIIVKVTEKVVNDSEFRKVIDICGKGYASPGWIDIHTHCFDKFELYSDNPDIIGYKTGVTTVVDAGTAGGLDIAEFYEKTQVCKTNVYAFLNLSQIGIKVQNELSTLEHLNINMVRKSVEDFKDFILGIKVRMSSSVVGENGIKPLKIAKEISRELGMPIMVHIGTEPPTLEEVLAELKEGDIVSHIFNGKKNGIFNEANKIKDEVIKAHNEGVIFDVAHGKDSFNFNVARNALENNLKADTISTDIYKRSREEGPVYSLSTTMNKMLNLGYSLNEVINMVTVNGAKAVGILNKGKIEVGYDADITIFDYREDGDEVLVDSNGNNIIGKKVISPKAVVLNGEFIRI